VLRFWHRCLCKGETSTHNLASPLHTRRGWAAEHLIKQHKPFASGQRRGIVLAHERGGPLSVTLLQMTAWLIRACVFMRTISLI